jgi:hypothetical protein
MSTHNASIHNVGWVLVHFGNECDYIIKLKEPLHIKVKYFVATLGNLLEGRFDGRL